MHSISRRAALEFGVTAAIIVPFGNWRACAQDGPTDELHAWFLRWSCTATGIPDLSPDTARDFMDFAIRFGVTRASLTDLEPDTYRGTAIEKRLLEAWYTGVFASAGLSEVRNYETTLMWRAAGIDPPPSTCNNSGPKRWASAPSNI
jgi:hypothetical protein